MDQTDADYDSQLKAMGRTIENIRPSDAPLAFTVPDKTTLFVELPDIDGGAALRPGERHPARAAAQPLRPFEAYDSGAPNSSFQAAMYAFEAMFATDADGRAAESGTSDKHSLFGMARKCAKSQVPRQRIYSTFLGIDVEEESLFDNTGIHKGVLLFRYAELMMAWMQQTPRRALKINESHKASLSAFVPH